MDGASDCDSRSVLVFFVTQISEELGAAKASKREKIFAENSGFRDVDGPFLELRHFSFFIRIRLIKVHFMRLCEVDFL